VSDAVDPHRWQQVQAIFDAVADLAPEVQAAEVARLSAGDDAVAADVARLIEHDRSRGARLAAVLAAVAQWPAAGPEATGLEGRQIGPYRLVRELGRGGMGVVYEARRDGEFQQRVALKVAPRAAYAPDLLARFRDERQILARLVHPRIARLLDGGTTGDGVPWFAMEFVDGEPIHRVVVDRGLDLEARLALFQQVCEAVEFAHQNLVVHRDLKPANILVTGDGVRLLDFGIAKLLQPSDDAAVTLTGHGAPITPDYGSPEQVKGEPITTRTDVYSLGLVLYELLTGVRAQSADTSSPATLVRSICEVEVGLPSQAAGVRGTALARRLRGDLDTIVVRAAQKDPARRYPSVAALADDVGRYLDGRPIVARQDSRAYRARRFVRRHWLPLGAAAGLLATLAGGIVATEYQARRAEQRFQQVRGIASALMNEVHAAIRDLPSSTAAQETVLRTAVQYLDGLAPEAGADTALTVEIARGYMKVAQIAYALDRPSLSRPDDARQYLDRAEAMLRPLEAGASRAPEVAAALVAHAAQRGELEFTTGEPTRALATLERGLAIGSQARTAAPADVPVLEALRDLLNALVTDFQSSASTATLVPQYLDVAETLVRLQPGDADAQAQLAVAFSQAGNLAATAGDAAAAREHYRRGLALQTAAVEAAPDNATARRNLMIVWANLADVALGPLGGGSYTGSGGPPVAIPEADRREAHEAFRQACAEADWLYARDRANDTVAFDYAVCHGRMAASYPPGDPAALTDLGTALEIVQALAGRHPARTAAYEVEFRAGLAERYRQMGQTSRADAEWRRIDGLVQRAVTADPREYYLQRLAIPPFENQALSLAARGQPAEARRVAARVEQLAEAVNRRADVYARAPGWPPRVRAWHAELLTVLGDEAGARKAREDARAMWQAVAARTDLPDDLLREARAAVGEAAVR
jgi:tetratricopeptide (TPR) repeat protein